MTDVLAPFACPPCAADRHHDCDETLCPCPHQRPALAPAAASSTLLGRTDNDAATGGAAGPRRGEAPSPVRSLAAPSEPPPLAAPGPAGAAPSWSQPRPDWWAADGCRAAADPAHRCLDLDGGACAETHRPCQTELRRRCAEELERYRVVA
ncbi:MAG TPA: hypothetical protein VFJ85_03010 [Acidimicrobiales bacterium]|nr:hypothetical protein [Acidimicrobiales bacterium]